VPADGHRAAAQRHVDDRAPRAQAGHPRLRVAAERRPDLLAGRAGGGLAVSGLVQVTVDHVPGVAGDRLVILKAPFAYKDELKALPGSRAHYDEGPPKKFRF